VIRNVDLFEDCSREELSQIADLMKETHVAAGTELCREGEPGREFFVIVEGQASVTVKDDHIATLGPGSFFGEMALLDDSPRRATVTAQTAIIGLVLAGREFRALLDTAPAVTRSMIRAVSERLRSERAGQAAALDV
jgi:CRP-like cAMP-binding protein